MSGAAEDDEQQVFVMPVLERLHGMAKFGDISLNIELVLKRKD